MLEELRKYALEERGLETWLVDHYCQDPSGIGYLFALYAHRNQYRENGEPYIEHPIAVAHNFMRYCGRLDNRPKELPIEELAVQAICMLHDVIEDTEFEIDDIYEAYRDAFMSDIFMKYIETPLKLLTHNKNDSYEKYMDKVLSHPIASLVKLFDLYNNLNPATLRKYGDKERNRMIKYSKLMIKILDKYGFVYRE